MSRLRTDLRSFPKRKSSVPTSATKFPPVQNEYVCRSPSASPQYWANDMVVGLQMKTFSPIKDTKIKTDVKTSHEKIRNFVNSSPKKSHPSASSSASKQIQVDKLNQDNNMLKKKLQELLDKISKLEKEIEKLKSRNSSHQKTIEQLKEEMKIKNMKIAELEELSRQQELIHKNEIDTLSCQIKEKDEKIKTQENLLDRKETEIDRIKTEYQQTLELKMKEFADGLAEAKANYEKELKIKDDKLKVLKSHMANALKDNSRERQVQLEELARELKKVSEEADVLKMRMHSTKSPQGSCKNCQIMEKELQNKILILRDKDVGLIELQKLCEKMEKQLMEQDELLRMWAKSKGKVIR